MCLYNQFIEAFNNKPSKLCKTCIYSDRDASECLESDDCHFINEKYDNFVKKHSNEKS